MMDNCAFVRLSTAHVDGDAIGLGDIGGKGVKLRRRSIGPDQRYRRRSLSQDMLTGLNDLRCGAIIGAQADDRNTREESFDVGEKSRVGTVPTVNGLVRVPDHAQVGSTTAPSFQQHHL
jgi:hypothetical protein